MMKYEFKDKKLLDMAFTHSSRTNSSEKNYERLEFLGDRVLGLCVAKLLFDTFPKEPEGGLSQRHTVLVCKETVAKVALNIGIEKNIKVISEDIRLNENVLCDVCEAIIGAIFIDGGFDEVFEFVKEHWQELLLKDLCPPKDAKTKLQETAHVKGAPPPLYKLVKRDGSEHEPVFSISVSIKGFEDCVGEGRNKKLAEQAAAVKMLQQMGVC